MIRRTLIGMPLQSIRSLNPEFFRDEHLTNEEFDYIFKVCPQAFWMRDNSNPLNPHAALTAGGCSNAFINTLEVLSYSNICRILAFNLALTIRKVYKGPIAWVLGSDHASAVFSQNVATFFQARHDFTTKVPKTEKENERQIWNRFTIKEQEPVLRIEELMTTGTTTDRVTAGVDEFHKYPINYIPIIGTCVNRSGMSEYKGNMIISLRDYDVQTYKSPEVCQWCKEGSPRITNPKQNMDKLRAISA